MSDSRGTVNRALLLDYFRRGAAPRERWLVGMEVERMGRDRDGRPIPYTGQAASVRKTIERLQALRGGRAVLEGDNPIGIDAPWGAISLEPGGQVEWSSRPHSDLTALAASLAEHEEAMTRVAEELGIRWLPEGVDPELPVDEMVWMPKARYKIMRSFLGERGGLAHRMMTQTASIQCAFDYTDDEDWKRKFLVAATLAPVATALFANSSRVDGGDSGFRSFRQHIWSDTDPARCGLPDVVFDPGFDIEAWLDHVIHVPAIFRYRSRGLVPAGGVPFGTLMRLEGCDAVRSQDWEMHASTIFTDVRSYTYLEVRSADAQPVGECMRVPAFWTGLLYSDDGLAAAHELGRALGRAADWREAMAEAARNGLDGKIRNGSLREMARRALRIAADSLEGSAACVGDRPAMAGEIAALAEKHAITL